MSHAFKNQLELAELLEFKKLPYAPLFVNSNDGVYYTVSLFQRDNEKDAMEKGELIKKQSEGLNGSSKFTGIVVDLNAVSVTPGVFTGDSGVVFPVLIVNWDKLH